MCLTGILEQIRSVHVQVSHLGKVFLSSSTVNVMNSVTVTFVIAWRTVTWSYQGRGLIVCDRCLCNLTVLWTERKSPLFQRRAEDSATRHVAFLVATAIISYNCAH